MCPCNLFPAGAALLTWIAASCLWSQAIYGVDMYPVLVSLLHGHFTPEMVMTLFWGAVGICVFVSGLREARAHADPINWIGLFVAVAVAVLIFSTWGKLTVDRRFFNDEEYFGMRAAMLTFEAYAVAYIFLQVRGLRHLLPRRRPAGNVYTSVTVGPVFIDARRIDVDQHAEALARLAGERDRAIAQRDQIAREFVCGALPVPPTTIEHDARPVFKLPGVGRARVRK